MLRSTYVTIPVPEPVHPVPGSIVNVPAVESRTVTAASKPASAAPPHALPPALGLTETSFTAAPVAGGVMGVVKTRPVSVDGSSIVACTMFAGIDAASRTAVVSVGATSISAIPSRPVPTWAIVSDVYCVVR